MLILALLLMGFDGPHTSDPRKEEVLKVRTPTVTAPCLSTGIVQELGCILWRPCALSRDPVALNWLRRL